MGEMRNSYKSSDGQPEGARLQKLRHTWEDNIKMNLEDMG
jgi:hypothetical protein